MPSQSLADRGVVRDQRQLAGVQVPADGGDDCG